MKKRIVLLTAIILTALSGCNEPTQPILLNKVESLIPSQPDSAYTLLSTINTDTLDAENFAHWCLLKAELSHHAVNASIPLSTDMEATFNWYRKHKKKEKALKYRVSQRHYCLFLP